MKQYRVFRNYPSAEFLGVLEDALNAYAENEGWELKAVIHMSGDIAVIMEREKPQEPKTITEIINGKPVKRRYARKDGS